MLLNEDSKQGQKFSPAGRRRVDDVKKSVQCMYPMVNLFKRLTA